MSAVQKISGSRINALIESFLQTLNQKQIENPSIFDWVQQFSGIPIDIFGTVSETFRSQRPEERKADGVYYTPQYIVDYIVENTVGKLVKDKTPKEIAKIKIVDPACGCGVFLLGAYQYLLDWHRDYYFANDYDNGKVKSRGLKTDTLTPDYQLTATEKKKILLNNIFGVDIDMIAVEVAKLSLLIKCVEGETEASIENTLRLFHEKVLPDIDGNIRDGNSLVDTNFYELDFDPADEKKIKPFHWQKHFPQVFKQGGFDAVIGNPPYVSIRTTDFNSLLKPYYKDNYRLAVGQYDLYALFIERGKQLLKDGGYSGVIVSKRMATNENFQQLREFYFDDFWLLSYVDAGKPFPQCSVEANILIAERSTKLSNDVIPVLIFNEEKKQQLLHQTPRTAVKAMPFSIFPFRVAPQRLPVLKRIQTARQTLGNLCSIIRGFECGFNDERIGKRKTNYPIIRGENIKPYYITATNYYVKPDFKNDSKIFKTPDIFLSIPKLVTKFVSNKIEFALDTVGYCNTNVVYNVRVKEEVNLYYLLGVLNSKAVNFWFKNVYVNDDTLFPHIQKNQLESIPIPEINFSSESDKQAHDTIVKLAKQLVELYSEKAEVLVSPKLHRIEEKITYCEDKIGQLVYELYGLTDEEIAVVEGI
jgi:hypothetical protein